MLSLRDIQTCSRRAFVDGDNGAVRDLLKKTGNPRAVQVAVYTNNARETFRKALLSGYSVVAALVGVDCFAGLTARYVREHPSQHPDLQSFGEKFPEFLERIYSNTEHRYLADVARLERAVEQVLLEREPEPLDPGSFANLPAAELLRLRLVPSLSARLVKSDYPILDIWRMHKRQGRDSVSLDSGANHVLVVRNHGDSVLRLLSQAEYRFAELLCRGLTLGEAFEAVTEHSAETDFAATLAVLLCSSLFSDITSS